MPKRCSIADARQNLPELVREAESGAAVELTRRGKPVAVMVSLRDYRRLVAPGSDFGLALDAWRGRHADAGDLDPDSVWSDARDRSQGRGFDW